MSRVRVEVLEGDARIGLGHTGGEVVLGEEGEGVWEGDVSDVQHLIIQTLRKTNQEEVAQADMMARGATVPQDPKGEKNKHPTTEELYEEEAKRPQLIGSSGTENPNTTVDPRAVTSPKMSPPGRVVEGIQSTTASKEARDSKEEARAVGAEEQIKPGPSATTMKVGVKK